MIDLHTHILPNIDDGAKDVFVSAELLRQEAVQGVKEIVFTPHYYGKRATEQFLEMRGNALEQIKPYIPENVRIRLGAEVHFTGVNDPANEALCALAIQGTKYVLFEFPFMTRWSEKLIGRVGDFASETGYTPIVAHAERYAEVLKAPEIVSDFVEMGCLIQLNTGAFLDKNTKSFAFAALNNGLVHCLGTDVHDAEIRAPDYAAAKAEVYAAGLGEAWEEVQKTMQRVLKGKSVRRPFGRIVKRFHRYF